MVFGVLLPTLSSCFLLPSSTSWPPPPPMILLLLLVLMVQIIDFYVLVYMWVKWVYGCWNAAAFTHFSLPRCVCGCIFFHKTPCSWNHSLENFSCNWYIYTWSLMLLVLVLIFSVKALWKFSSNQFQCTDHRQQQEKTVPNVLHSVFFFWTLTQTNTDNQTLNCIQALCVVASQIESVQNRWKSLVFLSLSLSPFSLCVYVYFIRFCLKSKFENFHPTL